MGNAPEHTSLRDHLVERAERGHEPVFTPSADPTLVEFARIFTDSSWYALDINKRQPEDTLSTSYEVSAERISVEGATPEIFSTWWEPVWPGQDPRSGFHAGPSSTTYGSSLGEVTPDDERTDAMLLILASDFVHLSASNEQSPALVRGAINTRAEEFGYVVLDPSEIGHS